MSKDELKRQIQQKEKELDDLRHKHVTRNCAHAERSSAVDVQRMMRIEELGDEIADLGKHLGPQAVARA